MRAENKKKLMLVVIFGCLGLSAVIWGVSRSGSSGVESLEEGVLFWVGCAKCGHKYQMDRKDYYTSLQKANYGWSENVPPLECPECGARSVYRAHECPECGSFYFHGAAGEGEFADKCTRCGYSETEEKRKKLNAERYVCIFWQKQKDNKKQIFLERKGQQCENKKPSH